MTRSLPALMLGLCLLTAGPAAPAASRNKPPAKSAKQSASPASAARGKKTPASSAKSTTKGRSAYVPTSRSTGRGRSRWTPTQTAARPTRPATPAGPSSERYREIQEALAARGYYQGEPTGTWDAQSLDALRRFQTDQNLKADGRINALSLIALGLGPKPATPLEATVPAASTPTPSQP